jgi:hypothetical protein
LTFDAVIYGGNGVICKWGVEIRKPSVKEVRQMKRITLFIITAGLVALGASAFAAEVTDEQKARLAEIEQYIEAQKQNIESRYAARLAVLNEQMRSGLLALKVAENRKSIQAGFLGWTEYIEEVLRMEGVYLNRDKDFAQTLRQFRTERMTSAEKLDMTPKLLAIAERRLADERLRTRLLFTLERMQIEKEKRYEINVRLAELKTKLRDNVLNLPKPGSEEMVAGIVYSQDKPIAVVGSQIVHLGEKIGKARVTAISPDSVEFEKNGKRWTQGVGDEAGDEW